MKNLTHLSLFFLFFFSAVYAQQVIDPANYITVDNFPSSPNAASDADSTESITDEYYEVRGWYTSGYSAANTSLSWPQGPGGHRQKSRLGNVEINGAQATWSVTIPLEKAGVYLIYNYVLQSANNASNVYYTLKKDSSVATKDSIRHDLRRSTWDTTKFVGVGVWVPLMVDSLTAGKWFLTLGADSATGKGIMRADAVRFLKSSQTNADLEFGRRARDSFERVGENWFDVTIGATVFKEIPLYNLGATNLVVSNISIQNYPSRWNIELPIGESFPMVIPPGEKKIVKVGFIPSTENIINSELVVTSNDALEPIINFPLTGNSIEYNFILNASLTNEPHYNVPFDQPGDPRRPEVILNGSWLSSTAVSYPYPIVGNFASIVNTAVPQTDPTIQVEYRFHLPDSVNGKPGSTGLYYIEWGILGGSTNGSSNAKVRIITPFNSDTIKANLNMQFAATPPPLTSFTVIGGKSHLLNQGGVNKVIFNYVTAEDQTAPGGFLRADLLRVRQYSPAKINLESLPDSLRSGTNYSIEWQGGGFGNVKIEYTTNNGSTWNLIATDINASQGSYNWQVPIIAPASSQCKIKISNVGHPALFDESSLFTIYAKVATPIFSPVASSYDAPQTVTISSGTDQSQIYFTLDGSEPTQSSTLYAIPILIDINKTLKAKTFKQDWTASDTRTGNYTISDQVFTVNFNTQNIWFDTNFDGKELKTIAPTTSISYGSIDKYEWIINSKIIGTEKNVNAEVPTGTWYVILSMTSDRGIVEKDSVKISVYSAEATTTGAIESAVSQLSENIYFVTSKGGNVYRFDTTGTIAWTIQTGGSIQSTTCVSSQDNIYVGSNDTRLYSFDYQGIPRWDKAMGGTIVSSPSAGTNGLIYFGISTGRLFAVDEAGNIKWSVQTGGAVNSSPSIDENGIVYFGSNDGKLYAVSSSGSTLWSYISGGAIRTSPALGLDSSIIFGSDDGFLYKLDKDGNLKWKYQTGGQIKSSPIIGLDGIIYFGSGDGKVYCISKEGNKLWEFNAGSAVNVTPSLSIDGTIYFGALNGTIFALDQNGNQKWNLQTGKPILAPMLVTNSQMLMVGDTLGKVYIMKIPSDSSLVHFNNEFVVNTKNVSTSSYEWWTFKGNNQRTGYRKDITTGVKNSASQIPEKFALLQNYPNPFNPSTIISYQLPVNSFVTLKVFDVLGKEVAELVNGEKSAGYYNTTFDGTNLSSGIYFYRLQVRQTDGGSSTGNFTAAKKLLLMK